MNKALEETEEGRERRERQLEKENEYLAKRLETDHGKVDEERRNKKAKSDQEAPAATSSSSFGGPEKSEDRKRKKDGCDDGEALAAKLQRAEERRGQKKKLEGEGEEDMEVFLIERAMQEDMKWTDKEVSDMCMPDDENLRRVDTDLKYYDENTWEELNPEKVTAGEKAELERFNKMEVYEYVERDVAMPDPDGKFVKVKWVRTNKGTALEQEVRCRLVAQELGYGQRMDELFAGTPSLMAVKVALVHAAKGWPRRCIMILDVKCAFLYHQMKRTVYIELPRQDPRWAEGVVVGVLRKAMYGTRDAPQIWQNEVRTTMELRVLHEHPPAVGVLPQVPGHDRDCPCG